MSEDENEEQYSETSVTLNTHNRTGNFRVGSRGGQLRVMTLSPGCHIRVYGARLNTTIEDVVTVDVPANDRGSLEITQVKNYGSDFYESWIVVVNQGASSGGGDN